MGCHNLPGRVCVVEPDSGAKDGVRVPDHGRTRLRAPSAELWRSPLRGPWLTSFLGTLLVPTVIVMALTGFISHWAYHPELLGNATINPAEDIPVFLQFPASWPSWDFAVNQGIHVTLGFMMVPIVLAKLWSVIPKLFQRPIARSAAAALERVTMVLLVTSVLVEMASGILAVDYDGPPFNLFLVHYYGAWISDDLRTPRVCEASDGSQVVPDPRSSEAATRRARRHEARAAGCIGASASPPPLRRLGSPVRSQAPRGASRSPESGRYRSAATSCWRWRSRRT